MGSSVNTPAPGWNSGQKGVQACGQSACWLFPPWGSDLWDVDGWVLGAGFAPGWRGERTRGETQSVSAEVPRVLTSKGSQLHGIFPCGAN